MNEMPRTDVPVTAARRRWHLAGLLLVAGTMLVATLGVEPVRRTQEARVLVTARELLGAPIKQWLVPRCNGEVRLRKPPLAYWASAASFAVLGVNEANGRLPMALAGLLMVAVTYLLGRRLFGPRAGLIAGAALVTCVGFLNYMRMAETDALAALFVTVGVYAAWRGYGAGGAPRATAAWFCAAGLACGLAVLSKGPPGAYPILFLIVLGAVERRWRAVGLGLAVLLPVALIVAVPWFAYVLSQPSAAQIAADFRNSAAGGKGHREWFFEYFGQVFALAAPWSGLLGLAAVFAARELRDARVRGLLVWIAVILVPLCLWGNKQPHYLLPLLPPLMLLVGAVVDRGLFGTDERLRGWTRGILVATVVVVACAGVAAPLVARRARGTLEPLDVALALGTAAWAVAALWLYLVRRARHALSVATVGCALSLTAIVTCWEPGLKRDSPRAVADALRGAHGGGPYAFWGEGENLPLCFELRAVIPRLTTNEQLAHHLLKQPNLVLIEAVSLKSEPKPPPPHYRVTQTIASQERKFVVLERDSSTGGALARP